MLVYIAIYRHRLPARLRDKFPMTDSMEVCFTGHPLGNLSNFRCHRVDGFGTEVYDHWVPPRCILCDWPTVWATMESVVDWTCVSPVAICFHHSLDEARAHAEEDAKAWLDKWTARCRLAADSQQRNIFWTRKFLYGPFTQEAAHILSQFHADIWDQIYAFQMEMAWDFLLPCGVALKTLTLELRRVIYGYAFSRRAIEQAPGLTPSPEDSFQILVHTMGGPKRYQVIPPPAAWIMDIPTHATINDMRRRIRANLWQQNAGKPPEECLDQDEMEALTFYFGWQCQPDGLNSYIAGTSRFQPFAAVLEKQNGLPQLNVYMVAD